jgi:predicted metal-dependent HD superfamily phosphohydrolase
MNYVQMLEQVKEAMLLFFETHEKPPLAYHNLGHTEAVVANAGQIARHYQLDDHDFFVVVTAAWFHDAGYYLNNGINHEQAGAAMASDFLKKRGVDEKTIEAVRQCILVTKMPQTPKNLLEQIVCDADLFHLGTNNFSSLNKLMRKEAGFRSGNKTSKAEWRTGTINLLEAHSYKTEYARTLLEQKKQHNLAALKQKAEEEAVDTPINNEPQPSVVSQTVSQPVPSQPEIISKKQKEADRPSRGIETMFRISSGNHQRLSDMADNKAHIMITTTSIILSVLLSLLLRKLEDNPNLIFPTVLLLLVCVVTMVFSILATRPGLPPGTFTEQDITDKKVNLLFFGNFYRMNYNDYNNGMQKMMNDREFLYGSLIRDLYAQGKVLGRKYLLLRFAYNIFMFGIVASVVAFVLAVTVFK